MVQGAQRSKALWLCNGMKIGILELRGPCTGRQNHFDRASEILRSDGSKLRTFSGVMGWPRHKTLLSSLVRIDRRTNAPKCWLFQTSNWRESCMKTTQNIHLGRQPSRLETPIFESPRVAQLKFTLQPLGIPAAGPEAGSSQISPYSKRQEGPEKLPKYKCRRLTET